MTPVCATGAAGVAADDATGVLVAGVAASLGATVGRLCRGPYDPTHRLVGRTWWRTTRTPEGPALVSLAPVGADVEVHAWGAGAAWALAQAPRLVGAHDHPEDFQPANPALARCQHRHPGLRVGATDRVLEALAPSVIEQRVTSAEAFRSLRQLLMRFGEAAPGPAGEAGHPASGMIVPLSAQQWAAIPSWEYLEAGVDAGRSRTLVGAARRAASLERVGERPDPDAALRSLPGVGPWTAACVRQVALGDPDAWSVGDYWVPRQLGRALLGRDDAGDQEVGQALAPYAGHRFRVEQLILAEYGNLERHGPRRPVPQHLPWRRR